MADDLLRVAFADPRRAVDLREDVRQLGNAEVPSTGRGAFFTGMASTG